MPRIRTIKPEFWQDEDLAGVSETALILAVGLLNHADDEGWFKANPALIRAAVFPLREPSVSIPCALSELSDIGFVELFEGSDGKAYGQIRTFAAHQRVNRPSPSKIKPLCGFTEDSMNPHGGLTAGKEQGTGNREGKGEDDARERATAPSVVVGSRFASSPDTGGPALNPWDERWIRHSKTALTLRELWNEILEPKGVPPWKGCPPDWVGLARLRAIELEDEGIEPDEAYWRRLIEHIAESEFLTGRRPGRDGRGFVFKPAWLLKAERFHEIRAHVFCDPGTCPQARQREHRRVGA